MPLNAIKNYVKEEFPVIYESSKFIRDRVADFNENREQIFEGVQQQQDGKDSTQINEEVRPIGSEAVLNGELVFWAGQNYGWQSKGSFDKLMDEGQFRMGGIAAQRFGNSITEAIPQEVKDFATEKITDAATAAVDFYQNQNYETQQRINVGLNIANGVVTLADQGLEFISEKTNTSRFITDEIAMAALTAGGSAAIRRATPAIKQGAKTAIKAIDKYGPTIDNIFPPTPPAALATAGAAPRMQLNVSKGKANLDLAPQVMEIASDMKPANWSTSVRSLQKSGATAQDIEKVLSKPYQKNLNKKYEAISLKELSEDKGGWLEMLMDRQDEFNVNHKQYMKTKKATDQRRMYDNYTDVQGEQQMYDNNNPIRKAVTATFNTVAGKEWHHIFGNKEAAETMLSAVTQDPYIAVNLIHYLKKIKLPTSGTPSNIALMDKALHRKKGGYHSWAKNLGIENAGKRKGDLVISDYVQEISKGILNGTADVNEIFSIIETYAKLNNQVIKPKLKADFGASIISEMDSVMKFVQGV